VDDGIASLQANITEFGQIIEDCLIGLIDGITINCEGCFH